MHDTMVIRFMNSTKNLLWVVIILFCCITVNAHDFTVDGLHYNITSKNEPLTAEVTYEGTNSTYSAGYSGNVIIPEKVVYDGATYLVTGIGNDAFVKSGYLRNITIPKTVTYIGGWAFDDCSRLDTVYIASLAAWCNIDFDTNAHPFIHANHLVLNGQEVINMQIPDGVTIIRQSAFRGCSNIESVSIPASVDSIAESAFSDCTKLKHLRIEDKNSRLYLGASVFSDCSFETLYIGRDLTYPADYNSGYSPFYAMRELTSLTLGNSVKGIGTYAFAYCEGITELVIPDSVTNIQQEAFRKCTGLTKLIIGNSVENIGQQAFEDCVKLNAVNIPNSTTNIGALAFHNCSSITNLTIPNSVRRIENGAFEGCSNNEQLYIEDSDSAIWLSNSTFAYNPIKTVYIGRNLDEYCNPFRGKKEIVSLTIGDKVSIIRDFAFSECTGLIEATVGNSVISIGEESFSDCSNLTTLSLGKSLEEIGVYAFYGCSNLANINIPHTVTSIGDCAFNKCKKATTLTLGNSLTSIGHSAFSTCFSLTGVVIPSSVITIGSNAFYDCDSLAYVTIEDAVTSIGSHAFKRCSNLAELDLGNFVTTISNSSFEQCSALTTVYIPNSVTTVGPNAFKGCIGLKNLIIGDSIENANEPMKNVKDGAFFGCTKLESVTIANSVARIGDKAFNYCSSLKELYIEDGDSLLILGNHTESSDGGKGLLYDCPLETVYIGRNLGYEVGHTKGYSPLGESNKLTSVKIGPKVTTLGKYLFHNCWGFTSITIPKSVTGIGDRAFTGPDLTEVIFEDGETVLNLGCNHRAAYLNAGDGLFSSCPLKTVYIGRNLAYPTGYSNGYSPFHYVELDSVIIGPKVTNIGQHAFYEGTSISHIISYAVEPPVCEFKALEGVDKDACILHIPQGTKPAYQAAPQWMEFFRIKESLTTSIDEVLSDDDVGKPTHVDVYTLQGIKIHTQIPVESLSDKLSRGIYIINGKKVMME